MKKKSQKYTKILGEIKDKILAHLASCSADGKTKSELVKQLDLDPFQHPLVDEVLSMLIEDEKVTSKKRRFSLNATPTPSCFSRGLISIHPRGFGFVKIAKSKEVFIPRFATKDAVDGDLVEIELLSSIDQKEPEGMVVQVLERNRTHLGGILTGNKKDIWRVHVPLMPERIVKAKTTDPYGIGDRVILHISDWGRDESDTIHGTISKKIGHIDDPSTDIAAVIEEFQLHDAFSHEALSQAKQWGTEVTPSDMKDRTSLLHLTCVTIDPSTAMDFDDALSLTVDKKGHYHLGVHIADVAHYVPIGSELDKEAFQRGNSTYFPARVLPMLPFELSANLCSLKENENRLTVSVLMEIDPCGKILSHEIVRSVIRSSKRFTYEEVFAILQKNESHPLSLLLDQLAELGKILREIRSERGSFDLSLDEASVQIDAKGNPTGVVVHKYDLSHQMVEEFMLKANEIIATHLSSKEKGAIFRIHEEPDEKSLNDFYTFARALGFPVSSTPSDKEIQNIFLKAKNTPYRDQLSICFIKSMKLAHYSPYNVGHYGLALDYYCHFTSPIRRYTDLIAERLLFEEIPETLSLDTIADNCSRLERLSAKAEQSVVVTKKLRLLKKAWMQDPQKPFEALVTNIKSAGIVFEIKDYYLEGFIPLSELSQEYLDLMPNLMRLQGTRTGFSLSLGERIFVCLQEIDLITSEARWQWLKKKK